ncbi:MAG: zonular occludens toxin domain-containing protein [Thermoplasmata archaeon]
MKLQLQTVNFYSGGLGSGKTLMATKTAIKLRNRSKLGYYILGIKPYISFIILFSGIELFIMLVLKSRLLVIFTIPVFIALILIVYNKREIIKGKFQVREIYSTYPIFLGFKKLKKEEKIELKQELKELLIDKKVNKSRIKELKLILKKGRKEYSKKFTNSHLLGDYELPQKVIVVIDEASKYFPNEARKAPVELTESVRWFRHFTGGTIIMTDQSVGDINIAIRRRINVVYHFSSFRTLFFKFFSLEVVRLNYLEDIVANVNNISDLKFRRLFDAFGKKRYESRYMRKQYQPSEIFNEEYKDLFM